MSPGKTPNRHLRTEREMKERVKQVGRRKRKDNRKEAEERQRQEAEERQRQEAEKRQRQEAEIERYTKIAKITNKLLRNKCVSLDEMSILKTYFIVPFLEKRLAEQQHLAEQQRIAEQRQEEEKWYAIQRFAERRHKKEQQEKRLREERLREERLQAERRLAERRLEEEKAKNLLWFEKKEEYWTIEDHFQRMRECFPFMWT